MLRRIVMSVVVMCMAMTASAQNYSMDALLKEIRGNYAVIECSGIAQSKKDAIEMAKKSAIYTLLYSGIDGLNNNRPLVDGKLERDDQAYVDRILNTTGYANYIRGCVETGKMNKTVDRQVQVFVVIELYHESLKRTLEKAGIMPRQVDNLDELTEVIAMPTIMVVPFCKDGQSYEEAVRTNSNMRMAISKVNEGFINEGVETKDLLVCLANAETYRLRMGDNMTLDDAILMNSGADVSVSVDMTVDKNEYGVRVALTLRAVEIATGNTLATKSEYSARKNTTADMLCSVAAKAMIGDFMQQISARMIKKTETGQSVSVRFTIDPSSAINMDTEINDILPLSDILMSWVKRHAKDGRYHTQGRTSNLLVFSDIYINNAIEDGLQNDVNDFALALYKYLRELGLTVSRTITGNSVDIIIY